MLGTTWTPNMRISRYAYYIGRYAYSGTLISIRYAYFHGILCASYVPVQPIFLYISFNMIGNRQYLMFTSNKRQNFNILNAQLHTCLYLLYYRFPKSSNGLVYIVVALYKPNPYTLEL